MRTAEAPKYVWLGCFNVPPAEWAAAKHEIREILTGKARLRSMISYSDLVSMVNSVHFQAFDQRLFGMLGQISLEENENKRPLLSVLVVHKVGDMKPGDGFFDLAESLGRDTRDVLKAWIIEVQRVYQYWVTH